MTGRRGEEVTRRKREGGEETGEINLKGQTKAISECNRQSFIPVCGNVWGRVFISIVGSQQWLA